MTDNKATKNYAILAVDDSEDALELVKRHLKPQGHTIYTAKSVQQGVDILRKTDVDLVITDMKMPEISGMELIRHIRDNYKDVSIIMITGYPSISSAVESVKLGADEYLAKPFTKSEFLNVVNEVLSKHTQRVLHKDKKAGFTTPSGMIGQSPAMIEVYNKIEKAAAVKATVLITGESGTGKELVARAIHYKSQRASHAFVPVNCGGIPETLLESELFGHVKGAFTGATETRAGFFQTADRGTIFLDEVSETSLAMQVKLLRVLQENEVCMVGMGRPQKVDVRIIAGSNKNLQDLIKNERFREDLFYRLNVINIDLPPLRKREDDVLLLINHYTEKYSEEMGKPVPKFSDRILNLLKQYHWPGNVRELENLVQRLIAMSDYDTIDSPDLPPSMRSSEFQSHGSLDRPLAEVEKEYIKQVLESVKGNKSKAAEILGIDRKTLRAKLNSLN